MKLSVCQTVDALRENTPSLSPLSQLSHELRTPLVGILGLAEILSHETLTEQQREYVNSISEAGQQLLNAVNALFSKIQLKDIVKHYQTTKLEILLVEDDPIVQKVHSNMLRANGHHVDIAENGKQALMMFANQRYDVILTDIGLPDTTGMKLAAQVRKLETYYKRIPIVALTAYLEEDIRDDCLAVGIDEVATKPISMRQLQAILAKYIANLSACA